MSPAPIQSQFARVTDIDEGAEDSVVSEYARDLVAKLREKQNGYRAHSRNNDVKTRTEVSRQPGSIITLPLWSDFTRAQLCDFARCALFSVSHTKERKVFHDEVLGSLGNITVRYTGLELRQFDQDVMMQVYHNLRGKSSGDWVCFKPSELLSALGLARTGQSYRQLRDAVERLHTCRVVVVSESKASKIVHDYSGAIFTERAFSESTTDQELNYWRIKINSAFAAMFSPGFYVRVDWDVRSKLSPMAKWAHLFFCSHKDPYAYRVDTYRTLSGSSISTERQFKYAFKKVLEELVSVGFLSSFEISPEGLVSVIKAQLPG